jgi:hypothetical protein
MRAVIVGHGPSIFGEKMGVEIDGFDVVIRQKRCQETLKHPDYYGTRTDVVSGSWTIAKGLRGIPANEYWVFLDSRHNEVTEGQIDAMRAHFEPARCVIDEPLCSTWNEAYRALRTPYTLGEQMERKGTSDDRGHTHMSAGLHTLIYACSQYDEVVLVGCDNLASGKFTWSVTRGPDWQKYPDHRWDIEHKMIPTIANHFDTKIGYLFPEAA